MTLHEWLFIINAVLFSIDAIVAIFSPTEKKIAFIPAMIVNGVAMILLAMAIK